MSEPEPEQPVTAATLPVRLFGGYDRAAVDRMTAELERRNGILYERIAHINALLIEERNHAQALDAELERVRAHAAGLTEDIEQLTGERDRLNRRLEEARTGDAYRELGEAAAAVINQARAKAGAIIAAAEKRAKAADEAILTAGRALEQAQTVIRTQNNQPDGKENR